MHITYFLRNWRFVATLHQSSLLLPFSQQHLLTLMLILRATNNISNYFIIIIFGILDRVLWMKNRLWSAIFDVTAVIVLVHSESHPSKTMNLNEKCCVCDCSTNWSFPVFLAILRVPSSLRYINIEIRTTNNTFRVL